MPTLVIVQEHFNRIHKYIIPFVSDLDPDNKEIQDQCLTAGCDAANGCTVDDSDSTVCFCKEGYTLKNDNTCSGEPMMSI